MAGDHATGGADDLNVPGALDAELINSDDDQEVERWARQLGVQEANLREAIKAVGPRVAVVPSAPTASPKCSRELRPRQLITQEHFIDGEAFFRPGWISQIKRDETSRA
jgi:hypothetical protein